MVDTDSTQPIALVIGASRGIGAAVARNFRDQGWHTVGTHRPGSHVPEGVSPLTLDITDTPQLETVVRDVCARGRLDVLVVCCGITRDALLPRMSEAAIRDVLATNLIGPMLAVKAALKPMIRARGGSIVLVSSVSAALGVPGQANYTASKAGLEGFARSIAREWAHAGIRINVVAPGPTDTAMLDAVPAAQRAHMVDAVPLGRVAQPEEVADVIYATSQHTYMTGASVPVAGGLNLGG